MKYRVLRGGSLVNSTWYLRAAFRYCVVREAPLWNHGFRVVVVRRRKR